MRIAYADPPYPHQARAHYLHDPSGIAPEEVDHVTLFESLSKYDAWALSTSSTALYEVLKMSPEGTRIGAWVKPWCSWKPTHRVQYAWEPVLFIPSRPKGSKKVPSVRDWVSANITMKRGTHGAKPEDFCFWLFELLGMIPSDKFYDLFPGSGAVTQAWLKWKKMRGHINEKESTD